MHGSVLITALGAVAFVKAKQQSISGNTFKTNPESAASAAAPLWHFDEKTCFPTDGTDGHGNMNKGNAPDNCNELKVNHNCPKQPPKKGSSTETSSFPTYWDVIYCTADKSWRVLYHLYFSKDTGHRHDWEWAIVKWVDDGSGKDMWKRDGMFFEHEGDIPFKSWGDIESTYTDSGDINQDGEKGKNHPKLYVAKWHHSVWDTKYTAAFANTCPPDAKVAYRSDDYFYEAAKSLTSGSVIDASWDYGKADSPPAAFLQNVKNDICRYG